MQALLIPHSLSQQKSIDRLDPNVHSGSRSNESIAYTLSKPVNWMSKRFLANKDTSGSRIFEACVPAVDTVTQDHWPTWPGL